ncbi:hypothetical protein FQZ97_1013830 [compost metagenome]
MHKRTANVQIRLAPTHKQPRGGRIDHDAHAGNGHDGHALCTRLRVGRHQPSHRLPDQCADGHQQQQRVGEGRQNAAPLPAVGVARIRAQPARQRAAPGQHQPSHIAQVVAGVGQQRQGIDPPAVKGLDRHKGQVQPDADGEGPVEVGGRVVVVMVVGVHAHVRVW